MKKKFLKYPILLVAIIIMALAAINIKTNIASVDKKKK